MNAQCYISNQLKLITKLLIEQSVKKCIFPNYMINDIVCMKNGREVATYCELFLSHSVINCSMFTLYALLNSNICLDGIQLVCCNCLYRTDLVVLVHNIHETVSLKSHKYISYSQII